MKRITTTIIICLCMLLCGCGAGHEWANTPGNMEETVNPGLSISFINARYAYSGELDFGELTYVYSLSTRKIAPVDGEYAGAKEYGIMCGGYPMVFIFIDK